MSCCQIHLVLLGEDPPMAPGADVTAAARAVTDGAGAGALTGTDANPAAS